jgi:hypothetical protein
MSKTLFLGRLNDDDDRNCIYTEHVEFECDHYWSSIHNKGAAWSGGHPIKDIAYDDITTGLTAEQWERAQEIDRCLNNLGYGIKRDDDRYKVGEALANEWNSMIDSIQGCDIEQKIMEDERERIMDAYNLDEDDIDEIFNYTEYHDLGVISAIYDDVESFGEEEAESFGVFSNHSDNYRSILESCFDYEKFGRSCMDSDYAVKLSDGRVVTLYC